MFDTSNDTADTNTNSAEQQAAQTAKTHPIFDVVHSSNQKPAEKPADTNQAQTSGDPKDTLFSDTLFKPGSEQQTQNDIDEAVMAKLKEAGYDVVKKEVVDENQEVQKKLDFIQKNIQTASDFIKLSDEKIVKEKVTNDFVDLYNNTGRSHLINTPEFFIEVEAEIDTKYSNAGVQKIFADNIRQTIKTNVIDKNTADAQKILGEREEKIRHETQETTKKLQSAFDNIFKNGFMNIKFEEKDIMSAYQNIINGNFTQEIKKSPEKLAELAMYYYHEKSLKEQVLGPTYGEGVKAAADVFNGKPSTGPGSPMQAAEQRTAHQQSQGFDVNKWLSTEADADDKRPVIR